MGGAWRSNCVTQLEVIRRSKGARQSGRVRVRNNVSKFSGVRRWSGVRWSEGESQSRSVTQSRGGRQSEGVIKSTGVKQWTDVTKSGWRRPDRINRAWSGMMEQFSCCGPQHFYIFLVSRPPSPQPVVTADVIQEKCKSWSHKLFETLFCENAWSVRLFIWFSMIYVCGTPYVGFSILFPGVYFLIKGCINYLSLFQNHPSKCF